VCRPVFSKEEMTGKSIVYITDVEGNVAYFEHLISISKGLFRDEGGNLDLRPNYHFVYGGDVCDRGKGDIRIASDLVHIAKKYPNRVHLVLGNRDVNKMRLISELVPEQLTKKLSVFWIDEVDVMEDASAQQHSRVTRLHTILECTMGAPDAYQHRVNELIEMGTINDGMSTTEKDELVVDSFLSSVQPGGCISEYLRLGKLAFLLGDVFFFHGGVHEAALGWVPPSKRHSEGYRVESVQSWCMELSAFHEEEISSFLAGCHRQDHLNRSSDYAPFSAVGGYEHDEPGSRLMQYAMGLLPDGNSSGTICYDNFLVNGSPEAPNEAVVKFLNKSGVIRTVTGHQPHGDVPLVVSTPTLQLITGDTSYAQNVEWDFGYSDNSTALYDQLSSRATSGGRSEDPIPPAETRGYAAAEIVISFDEHDINSCSQVLMHGLSQEQLDYEFIANEFIGRCTPDGWWVKALLKILPTKADTAPQDVYFISKSEGRSVKNTLITDRDLKSLLVK